jgi:SAM-dependent methyltransferase
MGWSGGTAGWLIFMLVYEDIESQMTYYDTIAKRWHEATGVQGGAFKALVLNDSLLEKLARIDHCSILELGAGNGYFLPLVLHRFSGQVPASITVTDQSQRLLDLAQRHFQLPNARYECLDVSQPFPFADRQFDIVIASMLFNEVPARGFRKALRECHRVLAGDGQLLIAVTHPDFITRLRERGLLKPTLEGALTMPGAGSLRLPVVIRSIASYRSSFQAAGFQYDEDESYATPEVLKLKAGLRHAWKVPIALVYTCTKSG